MFQYFNMKICEPMKGEGERESLTKLLILLSTIFVFPQMDVLIRYHG